MRCVLSLCLIAVFTAGASLAAETNAVSNAAPSRATNATTARTTFYVQLIRGNNSSTPPAAKAKLIGPKLALKLSPVFKWTNYWEIASAPAELEVGKSVRKKLAPDREVEIELLKTLEVKVSVIRDGKPTRQMRQQAANAFCILGGDKEEDQSWFIVVRRDNPDQQ